MTRAALTSVLERSRTLGFLGPGPVEDHIEHAAAFLAALAGTEGRVVDLGSGGGVPGLVLAVERPELELVLLEAAARRCAFLREAAVELGLEPRVTVAHGRAEALGRSALRGTAAAVVARGFGPPAPTAECGAPLLALGGLLVVSEPPEGPPRWPTEGLALLGLVAEAPPGGPGPRVQVLRLAAACPDEYPRRDGVPAKRPLF